MQRFILIFAVMLAATAALAGSAYAQIEIYAPGDFIYGQNNSVSLRGTLDASTGGQTIKVRQIDAALSCPTATGTDVPVDFTFTAWVPAGNPVNVPGVASGIYSGRRDSRFCIYVYFQNGGMGEANPNTSYSQVVHFRDPTPPPPPVVGVSRLFTSSSVSPERPYFIMAGTNEALSGESIAFVRQSGGCPGSYPGGVGAIGYSDSAGATFSRYGVAAVGTGFWRACAYVGGALGAQTTFSRAPKGGWKPKYSLVKGKAKMKGGSISIGSVKCPGPCDVTLSATAKGKSLGSSNVSGSGKVALKVSAGSARRGAKVRFKITTVIDQSATASKTVELKLR